MHVNGICRSGLEQHKSATQEKPRKDLRPGYKYLIWLMIYNFTQPFYIARVFNAY